MNQAPSFIIAGVMRGGTTSLHGYLRSHPEIAVGSKKELHFFDDRFDEGLDWYRSQFDPTGVRATGEATPNYLFVPAAMERIATHLPGVHILVMLRDPVVRAYSHYWLDRARDIVTVPFEEAVRAELAGDDTFTYVGRGRYREQIERAHSLFPAEQVHVFSLDELKRAPEETYATVCRAIGVDDTFRPPELGAANNAYVEFRSVTLRRLGKKLGRRGRALVGKLNAKPAAYPPIDERIASELAELYAEANAGLADLAGWERRPSWLVR